MKTSVLDRLYKSFTIDLTKVFTIYSVLTYVIWFEIWNEIWFDFYQLLSLNQF